MHMCGHTSIHSIQTCAYGYTHTEHTLSPIPIFACAGLAGPEADLNFLLLLSTPPPPGFHCTPIPSPLLYLPEAVGNKGINTHCVGLKVLEGHCESSGKGQGYSQAHL